MRWRSVRPPYFGALICPELAVLNRKIECKLPVAMGTAQVRYAGPPVHMYVSDRDRTREIRTPDAESCAEVAG